MVFVLFMLQKMGIIWRDDAIGIHNFHERNFVDQTERQFLEGIFETEPHIDYAIEVFRCKVYHVRNVPSNEAWTDDGQKYPKFSHTNSKSISVYTPDIVWMEVNSDRYKQYGIELITSELLASDWNDGGIYL